MPEASVPGVFVSGDVRFGALTGISSAVGEGAMATKVCKKIPAGCLNKYK
jgi:thioredoxin reductase